MAKIQTGEPIDLVTMSKASAPIGEIKSSMLDLATFNNENLGTWYLCDGQNSVAGTSYATATGESVTPDMRGRVPRMKDHGAGQDADGERAVGDNQDQATAPNGMGANSSSSSSSSTWANQSNKSSNTWKLTGIATNGYSGLGIMGTGNSGYLDINNTWTTSTSTSTTTTLSGDAETRMKNTCVNFYIKVEY